MLLIISLFLIAGGVLISMFETAIITIGDVKKLRSVFLDKIEVLKKKPEHFTLASFILKVLFFAPAPVLLGIWSEGKTLSLLLVFVIILISLYLFHKFRDFSEKNSEFVVKNLWFLLYPLFLIFKVSLLLPAGFASRLLNKKVNFAKREFEFLINSLKPSETFDENFIIKNVFEFNDKTVREIMVPRMRVVALDINAPREKVVKVVLNEGYSRLPVYKDTIDNIIGVVYAKDLINYIEDPNLFVLYDLLRPAYFVPETKKISELLKELQKNKIHMAIVVDEFGGFKGIVTLEDILEEIVGEIHDEYDKVEKNYEVLSDGSIIVDSDMPVSDFNRRFGESIPEGSDYESVGGFVLKLAGRIPNEGEKIKFKNIIFEVVKKSNRKIIELKITKETNEFS